MVVSSSSGAEGIENNRCRLSSVILQIVFKNTPRDRYSKVNRSARLKRSLLISYINEMERYYVRGRDELGKILCVMSSVFNYRSLTISSQESQ